MAEALVFRLLEQLASLGGQQMQREWNRVSRFEDKVQKLTDYLQDIRKFLQDAEKRQIQEESAKDWLDKLKAVSYEMDAVLDKLTTANSLRSNPKLSGKVSSYVHYFNRNKVQRLGIRRRTVCKIDNLLKTFEELSKPQLGGPFTVNVSTEDKLRPNHTTSETDASEVLYGRDKEKATLISKLIGEGDQATRKGLDIISVVGMGGIGKTALVKSVYNDVGNQFDEKIWVSVSHHFDSIRIAKAILEALKVKNAHKLVEFQTLLLCIRESIVGKRFLLVLDNVWTNNSQWSPIKSSLSGGVGSKILVTTRKEEVAIMMEAEKHMITLKCLSEEDYCRIFNQVAFRRHEEKRQELEEIGLRIARRCTGLPLVARVLGSLMPFRKSTRKDWDEVSRSELWELGNEVIDQVFVPFLLSYNDLSYLEKCCFLYCSYFRKDCEIDRDELIHLWMSQGYLSSTVEGVRKGVKCFENLAKRSLFQDFQKDEDGNIMRCKIHDILHDFVLFLTKNEYFSALLNTKRDEMKLPKKPFHCSLFLGSQAREVPSSIYSKRNLRTLFVGNSGSIRWDLLLKLKHLRTLNLSGCSFSEIPKKIDKLILLRYLNLSHNGKLKKLPKNLCNLFNLQTLKLECCAEGCAEGCAKGCAVKLPKKMEKLVNLRHLYLGESGAIPKELGKLSSLETLDHYIIVGPSESRKDKRIELEDLKELNQLKGRLRISGIAWTENVNQAQTAQLHLKEGLVMLQLEFKGGSGDKDSLLLENLQPHPNLEHLEISHYPGTTMFPSWMTSLNELKRLVLQDCSQCQSLGSFGKLPLLEFLSIQSMKSVKNVGQQFLGIDNGSTISFPKLKRLEFAGLEIWEQWESDARSHTSLAIMPCLISLEIKNCPLLKAPLPKFLRRTPLQNLPIEACQILQQRFQPGIELGARELVQILT